MTFSKLQMKTHIRLNASYNGMTYLLAEVPGPARVYLTSRALNTLLEVS